MLNQFVVKINALYYGCLDFLEGCSALPLPVCVLCDKCCNLGHGFQAEFDTCHATGGPRKSWRRFWLVWFIEKLVRVRSRRIGCVIKVSQHQLPQSAEHRENQIRTKKQIPTSSLSTLVSSRLRFDSETVSLECRNFINCCKLLLSLVSCQSDGRVELNWNCSIA